MRIPSLLLLFVAFGVSPALAVDLDDILAIEEDGTDFDMLTAGAQVPAGTLPDATFVSPGVVGFFNSPPFYVMFSNRNWGFFEADTATIDFAVPMLSVTIAARGSADSDVLGPAAAPPALPSEALSAAAGLVEAVGMGGVVLASAALENTNLRTQTPASLITFDALALGEPILGINLVNEAVPAAERSVVVIGAIGLPEPSRHVLLGTAALTLVVLTACRRHLA